MFKVGLTGGIACGKSTVARMLVNKGALLIDADQLARELVEQGKPAWVEIVDWLGEDVLCEDGSLDRLRVAGLVFKNDLHLQKLNAIIHPRVSGLFMERSHELEESYSDRIQIWDIPLLFEAGFQDMVDFIIVVACSEDIQIKRLRDRDGMTRDEAICRIRSQLELKKKINSADYVIYNDGAEGILEEQVNLLWKKLKDRNYTGVRRQK
ncbi:MAG: dephospho-CoA kinase [Bacillota bacterium]|nr:dephospho-CoA kinase [Bacillota bacterium]